MRNAFVTLFDYKYLSRGLTLYESLLESGSEFILYIIAFDSKCYDFLNKLNLKNTRLISLKEFEDKELLSVKKSRSVGEYCWTSTPKSIQYVFAHFNEEICTYIDSDIYFFSNPAILINEIPSKKSVMITEHRYSEYCNMQTVSGIYNVQFMTFKNNDDARSVLEWWSDKCIENCCLDPARGLCGDQKYLDDWPDRFKCVHVMNNRGGGLAPWNVDQFSYDILNDLVVLKHSNNKVDNVVFFHFHAMKFYDKGVLGLTNGNYLIPNSAIEYLYKPYIRAHEETLKRYSLDDESTNIQHFRDDPKKLRKDRNYYLKKSFL